FADRCDWAQDKCRAAKPALSELAPGRWTACIRREEIAPEMQALRRDVVAGGAAQASAASAIAPIIRVRQAVKTFTGPRGRPVRALKGVSIEVRPGESVGLVGESGSGKTTLGRMLVGLETPGEGDVEIAGIDASDFSAMSPADRASVRRTIQ